MITTDKVIEIFCIADDFCAEYENEIRNHQLQAGDMTKRVNCCIGGILLLFQKAFNQI